MLCYSYWIGQALSITFINIFSRLILKSNVIIYIHEQAEEGADYYVCKIVEMFEAVDGALYFTAQWFYRAQDTVSSF